MTKAELVEENEKLVGRLSELRDQVDEALSDYVDDEDDEDDE